jgi:hypothetical protein
MKPREDWVEDIARRQDNIDPIRRIPNGALFQGTLINGSLRLNGVQRVEALIIGLFTLTLGCVGLTGLVAALRSWSLGNSDLYLAIFCPFSLWVGWRITMNAIINNPKRPRPKGK